MPAFTLFPLQISELDFVFALVMAVFFGVLLGFERSIAGKHAGMRTYALVSLGSCTFVILGTLASLQMGSAFPGINPLQLAGSIIIGIGFIGSGLSLLRGDHPVELTTATGIWVAAGVGMACGFGFYVLALAATLLALAVFSLLLRVENDIRKKYGTRSEQ